MVDEIDELEKEIIIKLQGSIPLTGEPYRIIARELGITEDKLLSVIKEMKQEGKLRRISGILYHREAGFRHNGMVVWEIEPSKRDRAGRIMAGYEDISHVFARPTYEDWPFNLFSLIHGQSEKEVEETAAEITEQVDVLSYKILYSQEELKKSSMKYFCDFKNT